MSKKKQGQVIANGVPVYGFDEYNEAGARMVAGGELKKILRLKRSLGEIRVQYPSGREVLIKISEVNE